MTGRLYSTIGLTVQTWSLVAEAKRHSAFLECYGRNGTDSDAIEWLIRGGIIRLRTDPLFNELVSR